MTVRKAVTSESGRKFTIDTGLRKLTVDTSMKDYNPVDNFGYQGIDKGDLILNKYCNYLPTDIRIVKRRKTTKEIEKN